MKSLIELISSLLESAIRDAYEVALEKGTFVCSQNSLIEKSEGESCHCVVCHNEIPHGIFRSMTDDTALPFAQHSLRSEWRKRMEKAMDQDIKTLKRRHEKEGLAFSTKLIPALGKQFDRCLDGTYRMQPKGFSLVRDISVWRNLSLAAAQSCAVCQTLGVDFLKSASYITELEGMPLFLSGLFSQVVTSDGLLLPCADPDIIRAIRTICFLVYKYEEKGWSNETTATYCRDYIAVDRSLPLSQAKDNETTEVLRRASALIARVLANADPRAIIPSHGPGAVAEGYSPPEKVHHRRWIGSVERAYDLSYVMSGMHGMAESHADWQSADTDAMCKVMFVPKDSRGPRVITCEPAVLQWLQQGLRKVLVEAIEAPQYSIIPGSKCEVYERFGESKCKELCPYKCSSWHSCIFRTHNPAAGQINFTSQDVNRELCRESSITGALASIDMKDASDRVSVSLVAKLFPSRWRDALFSVRSKCARLPNGQTVRLRKYAGMGNAVTFPVEALCFWGIARATSQVLFNSDEPVYVYGDDILCSPRLAEELFRVFPKFGLKCNKEKSFLHGPFRESCGMDAFRGVDVSPLRLKRLYSFTTSKVSPADLTHVVASCNNAEMRGMYHLASALRALLDDSHSPVPNLNRLSEKTIGLDQWVPGLVTYLPWDRVDPIARRWCTTLQQFQYRVPIVRPVRIQEGFATESRRWNAVLQSLVRIGRSTNGGSKGQSAISQQAYSSDHPADTYTLPKRYKITWGWRTVAWMRQPEYPTNVETYS